MTRRVLLIGAFDRFNFGDLLFPAVCRAALDAIGVDAEYRHYALRATDLRPRGGVAARPLAELDDDAPPPGSVALVTGGEVLAARWLDAHLGLTTPGRGLALKILARVAGADRADRISRSALSAHRPLPWVLAPADLGGQTPVAYSAVGGSGLAALPPPLQQEARHRLAGAAYLSVRDHVTHSTLSQWGVASNLAPDGAALVAELWPREALLRRVDDETTRAMRRLGAYMVVQAGRYPAWGQVRRLAGAVRELHATTGLAVVLLPLGQAPGHEDRVPLTRMARLLADLPAVLVDAPGVHAITAWIASSSLFVGSSLHGNLTALAYVVPRVGFGSRVAKLDAFLRTWDPLQAEGCSAVTEIAERARQVLSTDPGRLREIAADLAKGAHDNFRRLAEAVF